MSRYVVISIRSQFVDPIFSGDKRFEFRRVVPSVSEGDYICVYEPKPISAVVGIVRVDGVLTGSISSIWRKSRAAAGIARKEYFEYFEGARAAHAIILRSPQRFTIPLSVDELTELHPPFRAPQGYWYLRDSRASDVRVRSVIKTRSKAA